MIRSLCIINEVLYLSKVRLTSLLDYLTTLYSQEQLDNSDQAQIFFAGFQKENILKGNYKVFGNTKGAKLAKEYLEKNLKTSTTEIHFEESTKEAYNKEINSVTYPLISQEYYEDNDVKMEPL